METVDMIVSGIAVFAGAFLGYVFGLRVSRHESETRALIELKRRRITRRGEMQGMALVNTPEKLDDLKLLALESGDREVKRIVRAIDNEIRMAKSNPDGMYWVYHEQWFQLYDLVGELEAETERAVTEKLDPKPWYRRIL